MMAATSRTPQRASAANGGGGQQTTATAANRRETSILPSTRTTPFQKRNLKTPNTSVRQTSTTARTASTASSTSTARAAPALAAAAAGPSSVTKRKPASRLPPTTNTSVASQNKRDVVNSARKPKPKPKISSHTQQQRLTIGGKSSGSSGHGLPTTTAAAALSSNNVVVGASASTLASSASSTTSTTSNATTATGGSSFTSIHNQVSMLQSLLLQWCFINAEAERAAAKRASMAEAHLTQCLRQVCSLREELATEQDRLAEEEHAFALASALQAFDQEEKGEEGETKRFAETEERYAQLMKALYQTAHRLPLRDFVFSGSGDEEEKGAPQRELVAGLSESLQLLLPGPTASQKGEDESGALAELMEGLRLVVEQENQELERCTALLLETEESDTVLTSNHFHRLDHILSTAEVVPLS
ncbi:hypothetical protein QOT17_015782 [Balamuthia mandrillaris]